MPGPSVVATKAVYILEGIGVITRIDRLEYARIVAQEIVNGSFETGDFYGWLHGLYASISDLYVAHGSYSVKLAGGKVYSNISQRLPPINTEEYKRIGLYVTNMAAPAITLRLRLVFTDGTDVMSEPSIPIATLIQYYEFPKPETPKILSFIEIDNRSIIEGEDLFVDFVNMVK